MSSNSINSFFSKIFNPNRNSSPNRNSVEIGDQNPSTKVNACATQVINKAPPSPRPNALPEVQKVGNDNYAIYDITAEKPVTLSTEKAKEILQILDEKDKSISEDSFSPYNPNKDRYKNILQLIKTMAPIYTNKDSIVPFNGALFYNRHDRNYILMQGPLKTTVELTQQAIRQNSVQQIVCLINTNEVGEKCYPYWETWTSEKREGFTVRAPKSNEGWGTLEMFHYENWPDRGVPKDVNDFLQFVALQRKELGKSVAGVAVHCSAGVGRTGVYMVTTMMLRQIERGEKGLNPGKLVALLRTHRPGMVQSPDQLIFCFEIANLLLSKKG